MYFFTNYAKFVTPTGVVFVHYQNISVTSVKESSRTTQNYFWREFKNPTPSKMELLAKIVCHKTLLHFRCSRVPEAASNSDFNVLQRLHWNTTSVIIITLNYQIFSSMASGLDLNSLQRKVQFPLLEFTDSLQMRFKFALACFKIFFRPLYLISMICLQLKPMSCTDINLAR